MPRKTGNIRGITIIELILYGSMTGVVLFWFASWLDKPARLQRKLLATMDEQKALRATDYWVNDLKQMVPGSLSFDPSADAGALAFHMAGEASPPGEAPGTPLSVRYSYEAVDPFAGGSLYRTLEGSNTVILSGLEAPEPSRPLFRMDPQLPILTMDVRLKTPSRPSLRVVRRVAVPN